MNPNQLPKRYKLAKGKKVGEKVNCPSCNAEFVKTNYQQAFCKTKAGSICKDFYWNNVTPNKKNNTTRISPASRAWLDNPDRVTGHTSEGYEIIGGVAYDEWGDPIYNVTDNEEHPFNLDC